MIKFSDEMESLTALDIVVIVYHLTDEEVFGTTYLYGEATRPEIIAHFECIHSGQNVEVVNVLR